MINMKKGFIFLVFSVFILIPLFSSDFSLIELSTDYYPDVYFTIETDSELDRERMTIKDNVAIISDFSVIEKKKKENAKIDIVFVSDYATGTYTMGQDMLEFIKNVFSIHESIQLKIIALKDGTYQELSSQFLTNFEAVSELADNEQSSEVYLGSTRKKYSSIKDTAANAFEENSHQKYLLYASNKQNNYTAYLAFEHQLRNEIMEEIDIKDFEFYLINDIYMGHYSISVKDEILNLISEKAFMYSYEYRFKYENFMSYIVYPKHTVSVFQGEENVFDLEYSVDLYNQNSFLFDVFCYDYPKMEFSYFSPTNSVENKNFLFYENQQINDSLISMPPQKKDLDLVLILENNFYSQYYNIFYVEQLEELVKNLDSLGYSIRIGLITYGDVVTKVFNLNWNLADAFRRSKNIYYTGEKYQFDNVLEAIMLATDMNFMHSASKNILFVQSSVIYFEDNQSLPTFDLNRLTEKLAKDKINFFAITDNNFFYDLTLRIPGRSFSLESNVASELYNCFTQSQRFGFVTKNSDLNKQNKLLLVDKMADKNEGLQQTVYQLHPGDIKYDLAINSITADPFIAKRGEVITFQCSTFPEMGVEVFWTDQVGDNFIEGNEGFQVKWVAPLLKGSYTIDVQVSFENYKLDGKVVVLVQ